MSSLLRSLSRTVRTLSARPAFTITVVVTLALGIGVNTAMFSLVYGVLLAPLPFVEPERIAILSEYTPGVENSLVSPITYEDWSLRSPLFEELAAYRFWENRTVEVDGADPVPVLHGRDGSWLTIIGVVGDVRQQSLDRPPKSEFYVPFSSMPMPFLTLVASASESAAQAIPALRTALQESTADIKVHNLAALDQVVHGTVAGRRIAFGLILLFAMLSVSLAAVGIYGVMSYAVSQRISELGVRLALGATPAGVWKLVTWQGLKTAMAGIGVGLGLSLIAGRAMGSLLFSVTPWDPQVYLTVPVVAILVAVAASFLPARRAATVDPLTALRHE